MNIKRLVCAGTESDQIKTGPVNKVIRSGEMVQMTCEFEGNNSIVWMHTPVTGSKRQKICGLKGLTPNFNNSNYRVNYTTRSSTVKTYELSVGLDRGAQIQDAGTYQCVNIDSPKDVHSAQLIVLGE